MYSFLYDIYIYSQSSNANAQSQLQHTFICMPQTQQLQSLQAQQKPHDSVADIKPISANLIPKLEINDNSKSATASTEDSAFHTVLNESKPSLSPISQTTNVETTTPAAERGNAAAPVQDSFFNETLELSQEDIQKTLSANMPLGVTAGVTDTVTDVTVGVETILGDENEINPMDFINNCCDDGLLLIVCL